jgi:predicted phage tail protein
MEASMAETHRDIPLDPPSQAKGEGKVLASSPAKGEEKAIVGHGGKGGASGGAGQRKDTIRSTAYAQLVDLISEGEIEGIYPDDPDHFLKGVYFDGVPVQNSDGSWNFQGIVAHWRPGTQGQTHINGFSDVENAVSVGVQVKHKTPAVRTIQTANVDSARVTLSVSSLYETKDDGSVSGASVEYKIELQSNGGGYNTVVNGSIDGVVSSKYQRAERIDLTGDPPWDIRVTRVTDDHNELGYSDDLYWDSYTEIIEGKFRYPNSAVCGITIDSSQFAHIPVRGYLARGIKVRVPKNYDPKTRTYSGSWDGTFKIAWTDNPAWIYYDMLRSERYGLGKQIAAEQIDTAALYQIAQYCDESVPDGTGGSEPRFTCNMYLQRAEEAFSVLQNMASAFRGISYWGGGVLNAVQDAPADPVALYNQANVIDGRFTYQGASTPARHSVALVQWNDPKQLYKKQIEYVEDEEAIARFGLIETKIVAVGCISRGQAQRVGRWLLLSERYCSETVTFSTGLEGVKARPGQTVEIADSARAGVRMGGRCLSGSTTSEIKLDDAVTLDDGTSYELRVITTGGEVSSADVSVPNGGTTTDAVTLASALDAAPTAGAVWVLASDTLESQTFRVIGVTEPEPNIYQITAVAHNVDLYDAVDNGTSIDPPTISALGVPDAPSNLTLSATVHHSGNAKQLLISAGWDSVDGLAGWDVVYTDAGGNPHPMPRTKTPHVEIPLSRAGDYEVNVRAVSLHNVRSAEATASATFDGTTIYTLAAPSATATGVADAIALSWTRVEHAEDYTVERSNTGSGGWSMLAEHIKTLYCADPLTSGETRYYQVTAHDAFGGSGAASAVVHATAKTVADGATATNGIYRGATAPSKPSVGDLWYDTTSDELKQYTGSHTWVRVDVRTFSAASAPSGARAGDVWFNTTNEKLYRYTGTSWSRISVHTYRSTGKPSDAMAGDFWFDLSSQTLKRYDGSSWRRVDVHVFRQASAPSGAVTGDLWYNTSSGEMRRYDGSNWKRVQVQTFRQSSTPSDAEPGDLWYDPGTGALKRYNGNTWHRVSIETHHGASAPSSPEPGDLWYDTSSYELKRWNGTSWVKVSTNTATYAQGSAPSNPAPGDLWYDTTNGVLKRWSGSSWVRASANVTRSSGQPSNPTVGDFWHDTDTGGLYVWTGSTWKQVATTGADWFENLKGRPKSAQNLIVTSTFDANEFGEWRTTHIDNPRFSDAPTSVPFKRQTYLKWNGNGVYMAFTTSSASDVPVHEGQRIYIAGWLSTSSSSVDCDMGVSFYDSDGGGLGMKSIIIPAGKSMARYHKTIAAPDDAATMRVGDIRLHGPNAGDAIRVGPQLRSFYSAHVERLHGGTNISVGVMSAHWRDYTLSCTKNSINWTGATLRFQGKEYNYSSHTFAGLSPSTAYYLAFDDDLLTESPSAYYADEDAEIWDGSSGRIAIPSKSGSSVETTDSQGQGGGGGHGGFGGGINTGCVAEDMLVALESGDRKLARNVHRGDYLEAWRAGKRVPGGRPVLNDPVIVPEACMEITSDGALLTCSAATPMDLPNQQSMNAADIDAELVYTYCKRWSICRAQSAGVQNVVYISLGGYSFPAGHDGKWILSHNGGIIPVKP